MNIEANSDKSRIEGEEAGAKVEREFEIVIPTDFKKFKSIHGGLYVPEGRPPYLLLDKVDPPNPIGEFHKFYSYEEIYLYKKKTVEKRYPEFDFEVEMQILKIGTCEEQVDIYIGYGPENQGSIKIYNWEENHFTSIENLWKLLSDFIVDYNESLF